jgi:hypothetical protein
MSKSNPTHYIGMNGTYGCMPDSCNAYQTNKDACDSLADLLELTDDQRTELADNGIVACKQDQGADYASVTQCNCDKPWEHDDQGNANDWQEYVLVHVKEFLSGLKQQEYQDRVTEHDTDGHCECFGPHPYTFHCQAWVTRTFYMLPYASFGDYDNSCAVERANAREFKEQFDFVSSHAVGYGELVGIDETDIDAITWEQLEALQEVCNALADYPAINDATVSEVEMELQNEAWNSWARSDFKRELHKRLDSIGELASDSADENEVENLIDNIGDAAIDSVFYAACEKSNTYWQIESGGNAYIDLDRVAKSVELADLENASKESTSMRKSTMKRIFDGDTLEFKGHMFKVRIEHDDSMGEPWKEHDGHGIVSDWVNRDKRPGERVLNSDRGSKRLYDFQESVKIAKRDGWGLGDEELAKLTARLGRKPTSKEVTQQAVENDYEFLRSWCNDQWHWVGVIVTMLTDDDEETVTAFDASLWGIESENAEYHREVAEELADECISQWQKTEEANIAMTHAEYLAGASEVTK